MARVHWRMGQALLPEHFQAQESSLHEDLLLRLRLLPMPFWGVGSLKWDNYDLSHGRVSIEQLTLLLSDGTLVDVPGNARPPPSFDLEKANSTLVSLYLHVKEGEGKAHIVPDMPGAAEDDAVERVLHSVELFSHASAESQARPFKLAEFKKDPEKRWTLSEAFIPPLLRVNEADSPFFEQPLKRTHSLVAALQQLLQDEIQQKYLAGENLLSARECLKGLYRFQTVLTNLKKDYRPHPFEFFRALYELYIELCMLRDTKVAEVGLYEHERLGPCFQALLDELLSKVKTARTDIPYTPFVRKEGMQVCAVPEEARRARHVYWLLQKPSLSYKLDLAGVKLASESQLPVVHQHALRGIPFRPIENPPLQHTFASEVEFFSLTQGEEWDKVVQEGSLAFYHRKDLEQVKAFLYWRNG
jgi:type VI secretion system protein ImpJ